MLVLLRVVGLLDVQVLIGALHPWSGVCIHSSLDGRLFLLAIHVLVLAEFLKVREADVAV